VILANFTSSAIVSLSQRIKLNSRQYRTIEHEEFLKIETSKQHVNNKRLLQMFAFQTALHTVRFRPQEDETRKANHELAAGLWSLNSNFVLRFQAFQFLGSDCNIWKFLAPGPEEFGPLKNKNHCIICTTRLPHKFCLWNRNTNCRFRLHHLKIFGSGHPKLLGLRLH